MLSQDISTLDDAPEGLSTLEVLDDISDIVEFRRRSALAAMRNGTPT